MLKNGFMCEQHLIDQKVEAGYIFLTYTFCIKGKWDLPFTRLLLKCLNFDISDQLYKLLNCCFDPIDSSPSGEDKLFER